MGRCPRGDQRVWAGQQEGKALQLSKNQSYNILIVESEHMLTENQIGKSLFLTLSLPTCRSAALQVAAFLTKQDIETVCQAFSGQKQGQFLVELFRNIRFINNYINAADKSLYFTFCQEEQYKKIEMEQIAAVSRISADLFLRYEQGFTAVMDSLKEQVPVIQQELSVLKEMLVNPDLPLPKLKRESQGMFCTSPFQLYLVDSTFNQEEQFYTPFQALKDFFSQDKEEQYLKQFMMIFKDKAKSAAHLKKIIQLRYTPYEITADNFKQFFIENNQLHNFIVILFTLTDIVLQATHDYVRMIADPLHRLVQLTLRYNIYRNYVLAVQEMLSFVFKIYDNIYRQTIEESISKPKYKFWRPAMTKWFLRMDHLHTQGQEVYMHCLTKLRNNQLKATIQEQCTQDQLKYGRMLQSIEFNSFEFDLSQQVSKLGNGASEVGLFFDGHPENYEIVVMEFNEYLVDISVNEQTVHWCGHSAQQLQQPYLDYEQAVRKLSLDFYKSLLGEQQLSKQDISGLARIDTDYISTLQIKNRTLKRIMQDINHNYQLDPQLALTANFQQADNKLQYFNHKALILAVVDEKARPFYSIPPHCTPQKLIDMIDTNDSESNNSQSQQIEYLSEQEEEHGALQKPIKRQYDSDDDNEIPMIKLENRLGSKKEFKPTKVFYDEQEDTTQSIARSLDSRDEPN